MSHKFNLNTSLKREYNLVSNNIDEVIKMYGIPAKYLFSTKENIDRSVFQDFSHQKVGKDYQEVYLLPEDSSNWEGDVAYNMFGFNNQQQQNVFMSTRELEKLYPDLQKGSDRSKLMNSLILLPSGTVVEITHIETHNVGINNLWAYSDAPSSYRLTIKVYNHNIADEGVTDIKTSFEYKEGTDGEIAQGTNDIDTSSIDVFFDNLDSIKEKRQQESTTGTSEGTGSNNTNSPFGNLG